MSMSMAGSWESWRHATKVDPGRPWDKRLLEMVLGSGTDAVIIGGTQDVNESRVKSLLAALLDLGPQMPVVVEVSTPGCLVPGASDYMIPVVLNARDRRWFIGSHHQALMLLGGLTDSMPPVPEFYIVVNPDSAVARLTGSICPLSPDEVAAYVRYARHFMGDGPVYLEGSGKLVDEEIIQAAARARGTARLFYGGGILSPELARWASQLVDTIVVGNLIYQDPQLLKGTVEAVKS